MQEFEPQWSEKLERESNEPVKKKNIAFGKKGKFKNGFDRSFKTHNGKEEKSICHIITTICNHNQVGFLAVLQAAQILEALN